MSDTPEPSVTRRGILTGSVIAGAAAAAVLVAPQEANAADTIPKPGEPVKATEGGQFREALRKLGADTTFRNEMVVAPSKIVSGSGAFKLSMQDLRALRTAALLSGVDLTEIDKLFAKAESSPIVADGDINCCCCCCCCGQSGAEIVIR